MSTGEGGLVGVMDVVKYVCMYVVETAAKRKLPHRRLALFCVSISDPFSHSLAFCVIGRLGWSFEIFPRESLRLWNENKNR